MGEARRRREAARRREQQRQALLRRLTLPGGLLFIAAVVVFSFACLQLGSVPARASEGNTESQQLVVKEHARTAAGPQPPTSRDLVQVYTGGKAWSELPLEGLPRGRQFVFAGRLFRVSHEHGALELVHGITQRELEITLQDYSRSSHQSPEAEDVVELLAPDYQHVEFRRLRTVAPGSRICFQNAVYETVARDGFLQIRPTGNVFKRVAETFKNQASTVVDVAIRNADGGQQTLHGTPEHPFYVPSLGRFVPMGELTVGTPVRTSSGAIATVAATAIREGDFKVFNFEVEDAHTYFACESAEEQGILVHNVCRVRLKRLIADTGGRLTKRNARVALEARPGIARGTRVEVAGAGGAGADVRFVHKQSGKVLFRREVKALEGSSVSGFSGGLREGLRQVRAGGYSGPSEIMFQVSGDVAKADVRENLRRALRFRPNDRLSEVADVVIRVRGDRGGSMLYGRIGDLVR